ncbi:MAG: FAD/NAD(P)-binding protein [Thermoplasmata archaeon]|nr:FAD/NAD(P)-binding protein [Thermoplasmata archaeon]
MASDPLGPTGGESSPPGAFAPVPCVVVRRSVESSDTVTLALRPADGGDFPPFSAGQFNMLYRFGVGEVAVSLSGDPAAAGERVHTVRAAGKVSSAIVGVSVGDVLGVRGPFGAGWPIDETEGRDVVVVVGGLGIAPVRPALYELLRQRDRFGRLEVIYGARTPADILYYAELQRWRSRHDLRFQTTVDAAGRDWYGDVGLVTDRIPDLRFDPTQTVAFLCGPEVMMRRSAQSLEARGLRSDAIFVSMERNMKCALGQCGHCQFGASFICRDGPVLCYADVKPRWNVREL